MHVKNGYLCAFHARARMCRMTPDGACRSKMDAQARTDCRGGPFVKI